METRAAALRIVGDLMYLSETPSDHEDPASRTLYSKIWTLIEWVKHVYSQAKVNLPGADAYWKYFDKEWMPKIQMWVVGDRKIPHAGQDTTAAIESFHSNMKAVLRQSKKKLLGRRMDWLIYELTGNVIEKYDYQDWVKQNGFVKNKKQRQIMVSAIIQAQSIPDINVTLPVADGSPAYVKSSKRRHITYAVHNPCTEWAICQCVFSQKGNICKHQVKVLQMTRPDLASGRIARYLGSLRGTAQGGVVNLLIGDIVEEPAMDNIPVNESTSLFGVRSRDAREDTHRELGETWVDDFDRMHQVIVKVMEKAYREPLLARHLDVGLRHIDAMLCRLEAEIDAGIVHPLQQIAAPLPANRDGLGMRLRRLHDFLDTRGFRIRNSGLGERLTQ